MRHLALLVLFTACGTSDEVRVEPLVTNETTTLAFESIPFSGELQASVLYDHQAGTVSGEVVISRDGFRCGWQLATTPLVEPSHTSLLDQLALATVATPPDCVGCDIDLDGDYFTVTLADGRGFSTHPCQCRPFNAENVEQRLVDAVAGAGGAALELRFDAGRYVPTGQACPITIP